MRRPTTCSPVAQARNSIGRKWLAAFCTAAIAALAASPAQAVTVYTWSPTAASTSWTTASDYTNNSGTPGSTDVVAFNGSSYANTPLGTMMIGALWFEAGDTNGITFANGGASTLDDTTVNGNVNVGIEMDSGSGGVTINAPLSLGASQTWLNNSASTLVIGGNVTNSADTLTIAGTGNTTINGALGSGSGGLTMNGSGTLILSVTNTYTGATTLNAGIVQASSNASLGNTSAPLTFNGGTLRFQSSGGFDFSGRTVTVQSDGGTLDLNGSGSTNLNNAIGNGGSGGMTFINSVPATVSTLSFANTIAATPTYTGVTTVNGSVILNLPNGANLTNSSAVIVNGNGVTTNSYYYLQGVPTGSLSLDDGGDGSNATNHFSNVPVTLNGGSLYLNAEGSSTIANLTVATEGWLIEQPEGNGGELIITNLTIPATATATFWAAYGTLGTGTNNNGNVLFSKFNGVPTANATSTMLGGGLTEGSGNGVIGPTNFAAYGSFGAIALTGQLTSTSNGTAAATANVSEQSSSDTLTSSLTINSLQFPSGGLGVLKFANGTALTIASGGLILEGGASSMFLASTSGNVGTITAGAGGNYNLFVTTNSSSPNFIGANTAQNGTEIVIADNGSNPVTLVKGGLGTLVLDSPTTVSAPNTYTGGTIINGGTIQLGSSAYPNALTPANPLGSTSGALTVNSGGTLNLNTNSLTVGNLSGGVGGSIVDNSTASVTLTIGSGNNGGGTFAGVIGNGNSTGAVSLTKTGTGTITLSGANTYTGATTINGGTLSVNGSLALSSSGVTVGGASASGTPTLGGSGTINGPVTISGTTTSGTIAGASGAVLTLTDGLTLGASSNSSFNLTTSGVNNGNTGLVNVIAGSFTVASTNNVTITGAVVPGVYDLFSNASSLSSTNFNLLTTALSGDALSLTQSQGSNQIDLTVAASPPDYWASISSANWDTSSPNWAASPSGAAGNAFSNGDNVDFASSTATVTSITVNSAVSPASITFLTNSASYTFGGANSIALGTGGMSLNSGSGAQAFGGGVNFTLAGSQFWTNNSTATTGLTVSGNITGAANSATTLTMAGSGATTLGGTLADGSGSTLALVMSGTGTVNLNGPNTYSGGTTVNNGVLNVGNNSATGTARVTLTGGAVNFLTATPSIGSLAGTAGTITLGNSAGAVSTSLTVGSDGTSTAFSGTIGQAASTVGSLVKTGAGTLTLSGAIAYTGATTVNQGTLALNTTSNTSSTVVLNGGTLRLPSPVSSSIGIKFAENRSNAAYSVTGSAGVVAMNNWNNIANYNTTSGTVNSYSVAVGSGSYNPQAANQTLAYSLGTPSPAVLTSFSMTNPYDGFGSSQTNQDLQLLNSYLDNSSNSGSPDVISIGSIPYSTYNVYVYFGSDTTNREGKVTIGGTTYYYQTVAQASTYTQTNSQTTGNYTSSNYAEFTGLSGSSLSISTYNVSGNNGAYAVEIVGSTPSSNGLPATATLAIASGSTLDLNGSSQQIASLSDYTSGSQGTVTNNGSTAATLTLAPSSGSATFSGTIRNGSAAVGLSMNGAGTQVLAGTNPYTGATLVGNGTLRVNGSLAGTGAVTVGDQVSGHAATLSGSGSIAGPVTVLGAGNSGGTAGAIAGASGPTLSLNGGLTLNDGSISNFVLNTTPNGTGGPALVATSSSGPNSLVFSSGTDYINLSGTAFGTLSGAVYDLYSFTDSVAPAGRFVINTNTISTPNLSYALSVTSNQVDLTVISLVSSFTWTGYTNGNWDIGGANGSHNWATVGGTPAAADYVEGSNVIFGDTNTITSAQLVPTGQTETVTITAAAVNPGSVVFSNNFINYSIGGNPISGGTGLTLNGTARVTLTGTNTYTGTTMLNAGTLIIGANANASIGNTNSNNGPIAPLTFNGSTLQFAPSATNTDISGRNVTIGSNGATIDLNGNSVTFANAIGGSGTGSLTVVDSSSSPAKLTLQGANTFHGPINLNGGVVNFTALNNLGTGTAINFGTNSLPGGTLQWATGATTDISARTVTIGAGGATFDINGNNVLLSSPIGNSGSGGLTLMSSAGPGTLTLAATNTYTGATNVNGGTLRIASTGSLAGGSTVSVNSGAALSGSGSIGGLVSIASSGVLAPSGIAGQTTHMNLAGGLTLSTGSVLDFNISNSASDLVNVTGGLTLGTGFLNIYSGGGALTVGTDYPLIDFTGSPTNEIGSPWTVTNSGSDTGHNYSFIISTGTGPNGTNQFELVVLAGNSSATWSSSGNGTDYGNLNNWTPGTVPAGVGQIATFGTGTQMTVSVNSAYTVGQLNFNNSVSQAAYYLTGSGSLTLNNSGSGASVNVGSGSLSPTIVTTLTLADSSLTTTFNLASGSSLDVSGTINESPSATGQQIVLAGGGMVTMEGTNTYTGGTTIQNGTLAINGSGQPGTGSMTFSPGSSNTAVLDVNTNVTLNNLSETPGSGGTAQLNVLSGSTLTLNQSASASFAGTLSLGSNAGLALNQGTGNTLTISGAPTLNDGSSISVNSGTLAFTNSAAATVVGSPTVSVASGGTLQLAGSAAALSSAVNITTHGSGSASDGALTLAGNTTQTVGIVSGDTLSGTVTAYSGNTTVGDGTNVANLTATQILQNTLTINAGSTVTIAPSGSGIETETQAVSGVALAAGSSDSSGDTGSDPFTAIQAAIANGSISSLKGQQLENRIAAIERLAATDPGLDVSLLEDRVLSQLPSTSAWSSTGTSPLAESGSGLLAVDNSTFASSSDSSSVSAAAAFAPSADFGGSPAAVPEPSTLVLAALGGIGVLVARASANHLLPILRDI